MNRLIAICNTSLLVLRMVLFIPTLLLFAAANEDVEASRSDEISPCKFSPSPTTCENPTEKGSRFRCIGLQRVQNQICPDPHASLIKNPIKLAESISEENFHFTEENKQICFVLKKSAGDNWKAFFGYVMEFDFFNSEKPADKITSRLLVSFPEGLQSEEEFTNSVPCIRTPKEYRYNETSFTSTVYLLTVAKSQIINQKRPIRLSEVKFVEAEEEYKYEYVVPEIETTKKHIVVGACELILIFLSVIGLFGLCLRIYRRSMMAKEEKRMNSKA